MKNTILVGLMGLISAALMLTAGVGLSSCGEAEELVDCQRICSRYASCFDEDYDVGACRDRCETKSDEESGFESKADACESCIDDRSCSAATFACTTECGDIVP